MTDKQQKQIFAKNLLFYISKENKTQKEVADKIGVSPQTLNTWCQAIALPRMGKVQLLADYFGILKSDLLDEKTATQDFQTLPVSVQRTAYDIYETAPVIYDVYESDDRDDLVKHADYLKRRQDYLLPNAAHAEDPTPEQVENADNIMNDPEEWT